jgi:DNA-binding response OmpR family regulator
VRDLLFIGVVVAFFAVGAVFVVACQHLLVVTQRQLLQLWGPQDEKETNYLRVYLAQIRQKLEPDPARARYFITEARMGYRFEPSEAGK